MKIQAHRRHGHRCAAPNPCLEKQMTTIGFQPHLNVGAAGLGSSLTAKPRVSGTTEVASPIVRPLALDRGDSLHIRNGRGTRVRAASGVLWITEENSPADHVLLPGDAIDLAQTGMAIVLAHRAARVVVEVPSGVRPPRAVEMALAGGGSRWRIALAAPTTSSSSMMGAGVARAIGRAVAAIRAMVETLRPSRDVARMTEAEIRRLPLRSELPRSEFGTHRELRPH